MNLYKDLGIAGNTFCKGRCDSKVNFFPVYSEIKQDNTHYLIEIVDISKNNSTQKD